MSTSAFKDVGELESLRAARESMASLFPLTPDLWKEWIQDERRIIDEDPDLNNAHSNGAETNGSVNKTPRDAITALFERAVTDYVRCVFIKILVKVRVTA